jgi:hypothetical protein
MRIQHAHNLKYKHCISALYYNALKLGHFK